MRFLSLAKVAAAIAVTGTVLAACVVVEDGPGMRPPPGPPPGRGDMCTQQYDPVCGERRGERQTFGNACVARSEGFRIVSGGECRGNRPPPPPQAGCTREYAPVCGERRGQRQTFGNACVAEMEGYRVSHPGECRGGGRGDGGRGDGGRWDDRGGRGDGNRWRG